MAARHVPRGSLRIAARIALREADRMCSPSVSRSLRPNSSSIAARRRAATSLQDTRPSRSPRTWRGSREFAISSANRVSFGRPASISFMCGTESPSSKTEVASATKPRPPTSMTWQVEAKKPIRRPLRKAGVTVTKSNRCPVPIQGSLVTSTSPGFSERAGNRSRKCATAVAMVLT